jgi:CheY-like chemotaxis protein
MKMKSVLLVNDNTQECDVITKVMQEVFGNVSVSVVHSGRAALDCLMGISNSVNDLKCEPDVMIISDSILDFNPGEICNVVANYYRFRHIKFYLLADPARLHNDINDRALFNGYLNRPFRNDEETQAKFSILKPDLEPNIRQLSFLPFLGVIKTKLFAGSIPGSVKAAACIACISTAAVIAPALNETSAEANLKMVLEVGAVSDDHFQPLALPLPAAEVVLPAEQAQPEPEPVQQQKFVETEEPVEAPAEPQSATDTVLVKKSFSIGIKKVDQVNP